MGLWSFLSDILGGEAKNGRVPVVDRDDDTRPPEEFEVIRCEPEPPGPDSESEAPDLKMSPHEQKRVREERRRKVTDLKRRLIRASNELDDTLAEFKSGPSPESA